MIGEVMDYCNNHFLYRQELGDYTFVNSTKKIEGDFTTDYYVKGSYIYVCGALAPENNSAFKLTAVNAAYLTCDTTTLVDEDSTDKYTVYVYSCKIPNSFLSLVSDIETWEADNASLAGVSSESVGHYSTSYGEGVSKGGGWQGAFAGRLAEFSALFSDLGDSYVSY
jgi:hypothetical protein